MNRSRRKSAYEPTLDSCALSYFIRAVVESRVFFFLLQIEAKWNFPFD